MHVSFLKIAVWLAVAGLGVVAQADYYVATNGNHTLGDNWDNALTNIQSALELAQPGDTVYLAGHFFALGAELEFRRSGIALRGGYAATNAAGPGAFDPQRWPTRISRQAGITTRLLHIRSLSDIVIERVSFHDGYVTTAASGDWNFAAGGGVAIVQATNILLRECRWVGNTAAWVSGSPENHAYGGGLYAVDTSGTLIDASFIGNRAAGRWGYSGHGQGGAMILSGGQWTVSNLVAAGNVAYGQFASGGAVRTDQAATQFGNAWVANNKAEYSMGTGAAGWHLHGGATRIENATVHGHARHGVYLTTTNVQIRNSILYRNLPDIGGTATPVLEHNCIGDGTLDGIAGNFQADPRFEEPLLYLAPDSPGLGAGDRDVAAAGLSGRTSLTNGALYGGTVNLGYHFVGGLEIDLTLYVCPDTGDDGNAGTSDLAPLASITRALDIAAPRTRIHLAAGRYASARETFPLTIREHTVQLLGTNRAATVIDATGSGTRVLDLLDTPLGDNRIEGLTLTGGDIEGDIEEEGGGMRMLNSAVSMHGVAWIANQVRARASTARRRGGGLSARRSSGVLVEAAFIGNLADGRTGYNEHASGGAWYLDGGHWSARHTIMAGNVAAGQGVTGGGLFAADALLRLDNLLVINNRTTSWKGMGTYSRDDTIGGGLYIADGAVRIANATIHGHTSHGVYTTTTNLQIRNSIIDNNLADIDGAGMPVLAHNCIGDGTLNGVAGNFQADPRFEYPLFYLAPDSPCLGVGDRDVAAAGVSGRTSLTNGALYGGTVNLGYHFVEGLEIDLTLYVCPDTGDDGNAGTSDLAPLASITRALDMAAPRTRIHLAAGRYVHGKEVFPLTPQGRTVQLLGTNRAATVIDAAGSGAPALIMLESPLGDNRLHGLTIAGAEHTGPYGGGLYLDNMALTMSDCLIVSNRVQGNTLRGGGLYAWRSIGVLRDTVVADNTVQSRLSHSDESYGGAMALEGGAWRFDRIVLSGNQVTGRTARGAGVHAVRTLGHWRNGLIVGGGVTFGGAGASGNGGGLYLQGGTALLENCTIADNQREGIWASGVIAVRNSILWDNTPDFDAGQLSNTVFSCSLASNLVADVQGNLDDHPRFADPAAGNYRLQAPWRRRTAAGWLPADPALSPAIDAGCGEPEPLPATDLDGMPRVQWGLAPAGAARIDMGAYETPPPAGSLLIAR